MVHRHARGHEARDALDRLKERRATIAVERDGEVWTIAERLVDPLRASCMRTVLDEDAHAVIPGFAYERRTSGQIEGADGAAALLGLNPHTLRGKMRKLEIDWARYRPLASSIALSR